MNTLFELAWGLLMQRYNHTDDILFIKTASGREQDILGIKHAVGMFIQDVPIRLKTLPADTPRTLLRKLMRQAAETAKHEHELTAAFSAVKALTELYAQRPPIIVFQNYMNNDIEIDNGFFGNIETAVTDSSVPEFFLYVEMGETFELSLDYDTSIYPISDMTRLLDDLTNIIRYICEYPDEEWGQLESHV